MLDEMSKRKVLVNEGTHGILLNRFAAAHTVEETIGVFNRRKEFGLESDLVAFQKFLMSLYLFFFFLFVKDTQAKFHRQQQTDQTKFQPNLNSAKLQHQVGE